MPKVLIEVVNGTPVGATLVKDDATADLIARSILEQSEDDEVEDRIDDFESTGEVFYNNGECSLHLIECGEK